MEVEISVLGSRDEEIAEMVSTKHKYSTRALLGACACISTGRKCVLNGESVPNELCIIN